MKNLLNLELVGPFEILDGVLKTCKTLPNIHLHYRYYYDTPEFMTVIRTIDKKSQFHIGYYRLINILYILIIYNIYFYLEIHLMNYHHLLLLMMRMKIIVLKFVEIIYLLQFSK